MKTNLYKNNSHINYAILFVMFADDVIRYFINIGGVILAVICGLFLIQDVLKYRNLFLDKSSVELKILASIIFIMFAVQLFIMKAEYRIICQAGVLMFVLFTYSRWRRIELHTIKIGLYILCAIGITHALLVGEGNVLTIEERMSMIVDKGSLTMWFSMTLCITFVDIINQKKLWLNIIVFLAILIANLFVIQSKTAIVSFFCFFVLFALTSTGTIRKTMLRLIVPFLFLFICMAYQNPEKYIPHTFAVALNQITGQDVIKIDYGKGDLDTYESRELIDAYCTLLFMENPITGVGLGNYSKMPGHPTDVTECENTYYDLLVEGGILYGGPIIYIIFISLIRIIKNIKRNKGANDVNYKILGIIISIAISFRWNDFLWVSIFLMLGNCYCVSKSVAGIKINEW